MQTFKYSFLMNKIFSFLLLLLIGVITACSSDPATPIDERKNKDHGDPAKVVLTLTQGKKAKDGNPPRAVPRAGR